MPATRYNGPMTRRRLPIGIQTFRTLRERDCYYVDKTAYVERLLRRVSPPDGVGGRTTTSRATRDSTRAWCTLALPPICMVCKATFSSSSMMLRVEQSPALAHSASRCGGRAVSNSSCERRGSPH